MDAQQWFYILGITFVISWFIVLIGLIVVGVIAYQRYQRLRHNVQKQGAMFFAISRIVPASTLMSIAAAVPFLSKIISAFKKKRRRFDDS